MQPVNLDAQGNSIIRAANFSQTFQFGTSYQPILSSTAASPIAVTLVDLQQSFANTSKVCIYGHDNEPCNVTNAVPSFTVVSSAQNVFSLTGINGVNGVLGTKLGYAWQAIDATNWKAYVMLLPDSTSLAPLVIWTTEGTPTNPFLDIYQYTAPLPVLGTFAWIAQTALRFKISLTHAQTAGLAAAKQLYGKAFFLDASGAPALEFSFQVSIQ
jgi:hypothetical protein